MKEKFISMNPAQIIDLALGGKQHTESDSKVGTKKDCEFLKKKKDGYIGSYRKN